MKLILSGPCCSTDADALAEVDAAALEARLAGSTDASLAGNGKAVSELGLWPALWPSECGCAAWQRAGCLLNCCRRGFARLHRKWLRKETLPLCSLGLHTYEAAALQLTA